MEALEPINAIADATPGFVWRLQDEGGDATAIRPFEDDSLIINMSVWESREALWRFVYDSEHLAVMRRRVQKPIARNNHDWIQIAAAQTAEPLPSAV